MINVEKESEKYLKSVAEKKIPISIKNINDCIKQAFKDGYKLGQKETFAVYDKEVTDMSNDYSYKIKQLQKENENLKWEQKQILEDNDNYQKENEELKNGSLLKELTERVKQQAEQIEKMKNMQNCKHNWETKEQCVLNNSSYCICDKWELAE